MRSTPPTAEPDRARRLDCTVEWTLTETAEGTEARLDWQPRVNHALIKYLTPVLRPLFRSNTHVGDAAR